MRFRHKLTERNTAKRVVSFLLMLCLLVPMLPSSIGLDAKAEDDTTKETTTSGDTVTITLHDLYIDRKEALPDDTKLSNCLDAYLYARKITVEKGTKLSDALAEKNVKLGTSSLAATGVYKTGTKDDKAMTSVLDAKNCVWYTRAGGENGGVDGNNTRTKFESSTKIDNNIDLYTYSYRIRLITDKKQYKDLIVREGQKEGFISGEDRNTKVSISDFLKGKNVDNKWTDVNEDKAVNISELEAKDGITRNYALRADGVTPNTIDVPCNVAINGQWTDTGKKIQLDLDRVDVWGKTGPALNYYVTDSELKDIYKDYGFGTDINFKAGEINSTINGYFPFRNGEDTLHIRQMPKQVEGGTEFRVPLIEDTTEIAAGGLAIYYTPHNTTTYDSNFLAYEGNDKNKTGRDRYGWANVTDATVLKDNSFYTVDAPDTQRQYVLSGKTVTVKGDFSCKAVKWAPISGYPDNYSKSTGKYFASESDGVTNTDGTFEITNIHQPIVITSDTTDVKKTGTMTVRCFVLQNETWQQAGNISVDNSRWDMSWGNDTEKKSKIEVGTRVYVTPKELESVYSEYGFNSSTYEGGLYFPHTDKGGSTIWLDQKPVWDQADGYHIPVLQRDKTDVDVYYIPNNKDGAKSYFNGVNPNSKSKDDEQLRLDNTFYSVDVKDEAGKLTSFTSPATQYFLTGTDATVTVPTASGVTWYGRDEFENGIDITTGTVSGDQVQITIPQISCATILTTKEVDKNVVTVRAFAAVDGKWKAIKTEKLDKQTQLTEDKYYYITAEKLEEIYGSFGFSAKDATGETLKKQFASTTTRGNDGTAKAVGATTVDEKLCVKTITQTDQDKGISLYYVPSNTDTEASLNLSDEKILTANNFYSISTNNSTGSTLTDADLPSTQYFRAGTDVKFSLPVKSGVEWYIQSATIAEDDCFILKPKNKTTSTLSVSKISTSIVLTATDKANSRTISKAKNVVALHCYAIVNGTENEVSTVYFSTSQSAKFSGNDRTYISTQVLENIYADYGFVASEYTGERYFPNTAHGTTEVDGDKPWTLWVDTAPIQDGDYYKIPLLFAKTTKVNIDVIYSPHNKSGYNSYFGENQTEGQDRTGNSEKGKQFISDNTFYTIDFEDPEGKFDDIPDTQYALTGTDKTVTLPYDENVNWFIDSDGSVTKLALTNILDDKKTATYTFKNVSKPIKLTTNGIADDEVAVAGYISVDGAWTKISSMKINTKQATKDRYYLTSADLEKLFSSCGFKASDYTKVSDKDLSKYFPSNTIQPTNESDNDTKIWTDAKGTQNNDGTWQVNTIQLKNKDKGIAVYYVPDINKVTGDWFKKENEDVLADNRFYTISFDDAAGTFDSTLSTMYLRGGKVTITVPYKEDVTWTVLGKQKNDSSSKDAALYVKQQVSDRGDSAELTFNLHSDVKVTTATVADRNEIKLEAYVSLDGTWKRIKDTGISRANWNGDHYYITEQELLDIYQSYGFTGLQADTYHFGITTLIKADNNDRNDASMWPDQTLSTDSDGNRFLPLIADKFDKTGNIIKLYYVPNNIKTTSMSTADNQTPARDNAFYSITFDDKNNDFPNMNKTQKLVLSGKNTTIELPYKEGVTWKVTDANGSLIRLDQTVDKTKETVTISIRSINKPLIITTGTTSSETLAPSKIAVNAYIAIDDAWVPVGTEWSYSASNQSFIGDSQSFFIDNTQYTAFTIKADGTKEERYYLTVEQLENIFGSYGFTANSFTNHTNIFPHNSIRNADNNIYADVGTMQVDGTWCVPLVRKNQGTNGISIYYTPTLTDNRKYWGKANTNLLEANSFFYTISAKDRLGILPKGTTVNFPEKQQVNRNGSVTYTLPQLESPYHWAAVNGHTGKPLSKGTTVTQDATNPNKYTVSNIQEPVQFIILDGKKRIFYDAQITREKLTDTSTFAQPEEQKIVTDGSIKGDKTKDFLIGNSFDANYTILSPDSERAEVTLVEGNHPRTFYYTFKGWRVDGTNTILEPGTKLSKLKDYQDYEQISLTAVWKAVDNNNRPTTVNFYVSLNCEIMDNTGAGVQPQDKSWFSESVYATRIFGTEGLKQTIPWEDNSQSMFSITASDNSDSAYGIDTTLREMTDIPVSPLPNKTEDQGNANLLLESFPTDEEVLANLRDEAGWNKGKTIKLDGKNVEKEDLTTDNFAVRWYVLKYQSADAWHIDGVLVAKEAHAVITKTFSGNQKAIDKVKKNYSISVTHEKAQAAIDETGELATQDVTTDYTLVLKSKQEVEKEDDKDQRGYDSYDKDTDTYTWILTGRQGRAYRVKENSYEAPTETDDVGKAVYDGTYRYMIKNCTLEGVENNVWKSYSGEVADTGIELTAEAYPTDVSSSAYQTISFENRYVSAGDFTVQKIDSATQHGLKTVNFEITRLNEDGSENRDFNLWREGRTSRYYVEILSEDALSDDDLPKSIDNYDLITKKNIITDAQGYFYIHLPTGKYQLKETAPLGYKGASTITITVDAQGKMSTVTTDPVDNNKWFDLDANGAVLTIKNESRLLTTVTALKQWNKNTKTEDRKSVVVELWRNGAPMIGAKYTCTLREANQWQCKWDNLPLFIDGAVAEYSLREIKIGSTAYDAEADSDGYADYNVTYDSAKYCESESRPQKADGTVNTTEFTKQTATWQNDDLTEQHYANHALLVVNNSLAKGYISFRKLDGINQPLAGAEFTLYSDKACTTEVKTTTSQSDGTVQFDAQPAGTYYMKETKAPTGYSIDDTVVYTVTVSDVGTVRITKSSVDRDEDKSVDTVMRITNYSARTLTLKKVSSTSGAQPLAGAEFTITRDNTELGTFTTDEKGETNFGNLHLDDGEYTITETKAPDGYKKLGEHIDIVVKDGTVTAGTHGSTDDWELTNSGNLYTLTVKNAPESNGFLPSTGGSGILLPILFGSALMCGASALALWLRKRRKNG